jgi:hypothetical protein
MHVQITLLWDTETKVFGLRTDPPGAGGDLLFMYGMLGLAQQVVLTDVLAAQAQGEGGPPKILRVLPGTQVPPLKT